MSIKTIYKKLDENTLPNRKDFKLLLQKLTELEDKIDKLEKKLKTPQYL